MAAAAAAVTSAWDWEADRSYGGSASSSGMRSKFEVGDALLLLFVFIIFRTSVGLTLKHEIKKVNLSARYEIS